MKRILSIFLTTCMLFLLIPITTFASSRSINFTQIYFGTNTNHENDTTAVENFEDSGTATWNADTATLMLDNAKMEKSI